MSEAHAAAAAILIIVAVQPLRAIVMSRPELWQRAISGSVVQQQSGSVLMSMTRVSTMGHGKAGLCGLGTQKLFLPLVGPSSRQLPTPRRTGLRGIWRVGSEFWWPWENSF